VKPMTYFQFMAGGLVLLDIAGLVDWPPFLAIGIACLVLAVDAVLDVFMGKQND